MSCVDNRLVFLLMLSSAAQSQRPFSFLCCAAGEELGMHEEGLNHDD